MCTPAEGNVAIRRQCLLDVADIVKNMAEQVSGEVCVENDCVIEGLLKVPFNRRTYNEKVEIVKMERPTPELNLSMDVKRKTAYVDSTANVQERFIGFTNVSSGKTAAALFQHVEGVIAEYNVGNKLIAQTYDGASVMAGNINGLKTKVQEKLLSVDGIGNSKIIFGEMRPRIRHRLPNIRLTLEFIKQLIDELVDLLVLIFVRLFYFVVYTDGHIYFLDYDGSMKMYIFKGAIYEVWQPCWVTTERNAAILIEFVYVFVAHDALLPNYADFQLFL
ncbi:hypothetical protein ANN_04212 [Periplaneta americana]|uniref:DUF4371 domain-containing protein n=1 Tax=Periplaneta americana TaxID=6978 RepID=A0ABQ8T9J4_PERAM|nr:hypothetical protein ANN_04212 [Periplaneta americana]